MYKNILLDLDGTVTDSEPGFVKSIVYALNAYNLPIPSDEVLRSCIGPPLTGSFRDKFGFDEEGALEAVYKFREFYNVTGMFECDLFPGVRDGIKWLKDNGYFVALCSSKNEPACKAILDHHGVYELFDEIVGASEDTSRELKCEVIEEFFVRHPGFKKSETLLVGDTIYDIEGANIAGIDSVGVSYGFGDIDEMISLGALTILDSFKEVCDYVWKH